MWKFTELCPFILQLTTQLQTVKGHVSKSILNDLTCKIKEYMNEAFSQFFYKCRDKILYKGFISDFATRKKYHENNMRVIRLVKLILVPIFLKSYSRIPKNLVSFVSVISK